MIDTSWLQNNFKYDYIVRIRTDCIIAKPLHFNSYQEDYVKLMIKNIQELHHCDLKASVTIWMTSLLDQSRTRVFLDVKRACYPASMIYDDLFKIKDKILTRSHRIFIRFIVICHLSIITKPQ